MATMRSLSLDFLLFFSLLPIWSCKIMPEAVAKKEGNQIAQLNSPDIPTVSFFHFRISSTIDCQVGVKMSWENQKGTF